MIRPYCDEDAPRLSEIHNSVYPERNLSSNSLHQCITGSLDDGGHAWVVAQPRPLGYALVTRVPGLQGVGDLTGCIAPERQRQGLGSELLVYLLDELRGSYYWQIAHFVTDLNSPAAKFLPKHNFFVEHEEWQMALNDLSALPPMPMNQRLSLQTYNRETAVPLFCQLYRKSFSGLPWDQPFTPVEVAESLTAAKNLLFLTLNGEAIGFAWVDLGSESSALIEPLGIVAAYQGQGFGRLLLLSVLSELKNRGARRVEIGLWRNNKPAAHLYRSLGFRHQSTFTYYAYNLRSGCS